MLVHPKGLLLDYDGTLVEEVDFDPRAGHEQLLARAAYQPEHVSLEAIWDRANKVSAAVAARQDQYQLETPWLTITRLIHDFLGIRFAAPWSELELAFWQASVTTRPMLGAQEALEEFYCYGIPIAVVSNCSFGPDVLRCELAKYGLADRLAFIMVSAEYAVRKPHPLLLETAAAKLGLQPKAIWFVGDRLDTDIAGARSEWLKEKRRLNEAQEDMIYAPIYDDHWGTISPTHRQVFHRFLSLCPPQGRILDAPCSTGKYWPLMLANGRMVFGIDQSQGMLARAHEKFPEVPCEKLGLQELRFQDAFEGALCIDALEVVPPEDWPLVLGNLYRALKPSGYLYFTVELATAQDIEKAFVAGRQACRLSMANGRRKAGIMLTGRKTFYHYYPQLEQVKEWLQRAGFHLLDETVGDEYHHFVVQKE